MDKTDEIGEIRAKFEHETGMTSYENLEKYSAWLELEYQKERRSGVRMSGDLGEAYGNVSILDESLK